MNILGFNFDHDGSVCLVMNGKLVSAISSERITRIKKMHGVTSHVVKYVLDSQNISIEDIDAIALSDYNLEYSNGVLQLYDNQLKIFNTRQTLFGNEYAEISGVIMGRVVPAYIIPHHTCHAASAYYTSNFDESWCFSLDASGGVSQHNSLIAKGKGNKLNVLGSPGLTVGMGYEVFTSKLGIGNPLHKAGSTMGLASYGKPLKNLLNNIDEYIEKCYVPFGTDKQVIWDYYDYLWEKLFGSSKFLFKEQSSSKLAMNIAASIQHLFEESILNTVNNLIENDNNNNLCLSGGSFLNCNVNSKIKKQTRFKDIHLFPACGDDGNSVGAALYVAHNIFDEPRYKYEPQDLMYLGKKYEIIEPDYKQIAKMISEGKIIAWFMGASEYGPRALGSRSILADPRNFHNRELINFVVKKREWYRPLAPVVLEEHVTDWFDWTGQSNYMLFIAKVLHPEKIPAVVHIDGTARLQTVNEKINKHYYKLIKEFFNQTGVPILINTSLNSDGEPILESEEDAKLFFSTNPGIDVLVLNGKILKK